MSGAVIACRGGPAGPRLAAQLPARGPLSTPRPARAGVRRLTRPLRPLIDGIRAAGEGSGPDAPAPEAAPSASSSLSSSSSSSPTPARTGAPRAPPAPQPDQSAFSNAVVSTALVWAAAALFGLDPWAAARVEPLPASLVTGALLGVPYAAALAAVRATCGGVWWSEVEGHGVLGSLPALRAATFAAGVAWADSVVWRGLALAAARGVIEAPGGAPGADAAAAAAAAAAATAPAPPGADPLALWAAGSAAVDAAAAAAAASPLAGALGAPLVPPTPLPAAWLAPFVALGLGGAAAALACYEPPGQYSVDDRADDPTAPPVTLRELAWAYWSEEEEEGREGDGAGDASPSSPSSSSFMGSLAARVAGWKAAANDADAAAAAAAAKAEASKPGGKRPGGFWENLLVPEEEEEEGDDDGSDDDEWLAAALGLTAGTAVPRWPRAPGALRAWVVPTLVTLEGAALAWEALATGSFTAPLVTQAVGLFGLWALEARLKRAGGGGGAAPSTTTAPPGTVRLNDVPLQDVASLLAGKTDVDSLRARMAADAEDAAPTGSKDE